MMRKLLQAILCIILCPLLAAQRAALPDNPEPVNAGAGDASSPCADGVKLTHNRSKASPWRLFCP